MNYCIAAFAIVLIVSTIQWFVDGRKNFRGPKVDLDARQTGDVMGLAVDSREDGSSGESSELGALEPKDK